MSDMNENEVNTFKDFSQWHLSINTVESSSLLEK